MLAVGTDRVRGLHRSPAGGLFDAARRGLLQGFVWYRYFMRRVISRDATMVRKFAASGVAAPPHPHGVRPIGQQMLNDEPNPRDAPHALGVLRALPDEVLLGILGCCDGATLARCAAASRVLRTFCLAEPLWRALYLDELPDGAQLVFDRSWRRSYLRFAAGAAAPAELARGATSALFSDALFVPWFCGAASLPPRWFGGADSIERVDGASLSVAEFERRFEAPGVPVILTGLVDRWPAAKLWSEASLRARFGAQCFHVGGHECRLDGFFDYCASTADEQPLYLFDKEFAEKAPPLAAEYEVPPFFAPERDLFDALRRAACAPTTAGSSSAARGAGSCGTSTRTRRRRGMGSSRGRSAGCSRRRAAAAARRAALRRHGDRLAVGLALRVVPRLPRRLRRAPPHRRRPPRPVEATVRAGELIFVPRGWWHAALNLEPATVAITQNYAPPSAARTVLAYLRRPDLVPECRRRPPGDARPLRRGAPPPLPEALADDGGGDDADEPRGRAAQRVELGGGAFSFGFA